VDFSGKYTNYGRITPEKRLFYVGFPVGGV
jgi:hypothetical protein